MEQGFSTADKWFGRESSYVRRFSTTSKLPLLGDSSKHRFETVKTPSNAECRFMVHNADSARNRSVGPVLDMT
jgi:hypothetical protein